MKTVQQLNSLWMAVAMSASALTATAAPAPAPTPAPTAPPSLPSQLICAPTPLRCSPGIESGLTLQAHFGNWVGSKSVKVCADGKPVTIAPAICGMTWKYDPAAAAAMHSRENAVGAQPTMHINP